MKRSKTFIVTIPVMILLIGLIIYQYGFLSVQDRLQEIKEEQAIKTRTLEKYISLISERPQLEKTLASLNETRKSLDEKLIEGNTPALAAANLQETVKNIVMSAGGTFTSERIGKPEELKKFRIITVSMDIVLPDIKALGDILHAIETKTPYLILNDLDVRVRNFRDPRELTVKMDVSALTSGK